MADLAYDASDPASSEPAGIAPQQANRPSSSDDKEKLRVFISYSRDDLDFADQLDDALNACGFKCLIDRHGISGGEDWKRRLGNLITEADTVVFAQHMLFIHPRFEDYENARVLVVECKRSPTPVYVKDGNMEHFFIRTGAATTELTGNQMQQFIKHRFR